MSFAPKGVILESVKKIIIFIVGPSHVASAFASFALVESTRGVIADLTWPFAFAVLELRNILSVVA